MTDDRWRQLSDLYHRALERSGRDREEFLRQACRGDAELLEEITSLLAQPVSTERFMTDLPGKIGAYHILSKLGAGGMGEVYRARDTKLGRDVAIKILPDSVATDSGRVSRFRREAQLLASLNHPNIAAIYGFEESGDVRALVLELVDGPTLAERVAQRPIPLDEALPIATQIAQALEAAHEHGIVHRDLKPANIKLTHDGTVKVLDFGLAKALETHIASAAAEPLSDSPRISAPATTAANVILGTAAYMSPEQVLGKPVDRRNDIWAFGCVLYEMLTGRPAFDGEEISDVLAAVLRAEPDWNLLPRTTPIGVTYVLHRCLERDLKRRIADFADVRYELEESNARPFASVSAAAKSRWATSVAAVAGLAIGVVVMSLPPRSSRDTVPATAPVTRSLVRVAPADQISGLPDDGMDARGHPSRTSIALSPDGRSLVFSATKDGSQQLFLRALDRLEAAPIAGTENGTNPFFSPQGDWIGFWSAGWLRKIRVSGGASTAICQTDFLMMGASWSTDDSIVYATVIGPLWQVPASGGLPRAITTIDKSKGEASHRLPFALPGKRAVLFTVARTAFPTWDDTTIAVQNLDTGERKTLVEGGADARYVSSGHLVYVRRGTLMAIPFSIDELSVAGGSVTIMNGVMQSANMPQNGLDSGAGQFAASASGALAYVPGSLYEFPGRAVVWIDRKGNEEHLKITPRAYMYPRLSPDRKQIALSTQGERAIWLHDLSRSNEVKLITDGRSVAPVWTPDSQGVVFGSSIAGPENLFLKRLDSSAPQRIAGDALGPQQRAAAWSKSSDTLVYVQDGNGYDIWALERGKPRPVIATKFDETYPDFSPDGRWLAYTSNESGREEVYVVSYPTPGKPMLISTNGGIAPSWNSNGRELFYVEPIGRTGSGAPDSTRMISVAVTTSPKFEPGHPVPLFEARFIVANVVRGYDVAPDGQRFLIVRSPERPPIKPDSIVLVQNWAQDLARTLPGR